MSEKDAEKLLDTMPTQEEEKTARTVVVTDREGPSWTALGRSEAEMPKPPKRVDGIVDDGRTDRARRWKVGEEILGRYLVERELGQGGMGVVYGCLDKLGGVRVAVKGLPPDLSHDSIEMEEVRENFRLVGDLRHPCIAGVRTLEKDERGEFYLVMDLVEGESLRKWERDKRKAGGVSLKEAVAVLRQVASALDYAHGRKVVHRDVKPGNVMIDGKGEVKVLDFGLADQIRTSLSRVSHVHRGTSGTGPYMSPEQWRGQPQDGKTDQYALGVMAYEMLAGRLPFGSSEPGVLQEIVLKEEPSAIPGLSENAMRAIRRAMAKQAKGRFRSCGEFVEALERARLEGRGNRCRTLVGWSAALLLAAAVAVGVWGWSKHGTDVTVLERLSFHEAAGLEGEAEVAAGKKTGKEPLEEEQVPDAEAMQPVQREGEKPACPEPEGKTEAAPLVAEVEEEPVTEHLLAEVAAPAVEPPMQNAPDSMDTTESDGESREEHAFAETPAAEAAVSAEVAQAEGTKVIPLPGGGKMEMVWCQEGKFIMGSPPGEEGRECNEVQHRETLPQGFWMAKHEVTQAQWKSVMGATNNPSGFKGDDLPVENVSWEDCQKFCEKAGEGLRLPTEAEWEYACRALSTTAYSWGHALNGDRANCDGTHPCGSREKGPYMGQTVPVGHYSTNAWGLCDMHGNVWEWCSDTFTDDSGEADPNRSWWDDRSEDGVRRVVRGGSWDSEARFCRSAYRGSCPERYHDNRTGFRPVQR